MRQVRRVVTAALEVQRAAKVIGASLEAAPVVHVDDAAVGEAAARRSISPTSASPRRSQITTDPSPEEAFRLPEVPGVGVVFEPAEGEKCQRCWKILPDVGTHSHPGVCARCEAALS